MKLKDYHSKEEDVVEVYCSAQDRPVVEAVDSDNNNESMKAVDDDNNSNNNSHWLGNYLPKALSTQAVDEEMNIEEIEDDEVEEDRISTYFQVGS